MRLTAFLVSLSCLSIALPLAADGSVAPLPAGDLPSVLLHVPETPRHLLVVEKSSQRTLVYRADAGGLELVRVLPCTTGKIAGDKQFEGDLRTPEGAYWFTRAIPGETLPPLYGAGAFVMTYPNHFDRLEGKTGSGIWLHGVESNDRVYLGGDTRGCVALRNDHFDELAPSIALRDTPIVVVETIEWTNPARLEREARTVLDFIESWRASWEAGRLSPYLDHYGERFLADGLDLDGWAQRKERLASLHDEIHIALDDILVLREKGRAWARFRQEYLASGHRDVGVKTLFLEAGDSADTDWRIVGETWRPLGEPFTLLDPASLGTPLTVEQVASVAPDAAPAGASASPGKPPVAPEIAVALSSTEDGPEPERASTGEVPPESHEPEVPEPAPAASTDDGSAQGPKAPITGEAESPAPGADRSDAPVPAAVPRTSDDASTAPPGAQGAQGTDDLAPPLAWRAAARLAPAERDTGRYALLGPHARVVAGRLRLAVSLLNTRPSTRREGHVRLLATMPSGDTVSEPAGADADSPGRPFRFRQGETLSMELAPPPSGGEVIVTVRVREDNGRVALVQDIVASVEAIR